jgi:IclR family pca regulon transcriptional regulator
MGRTLRAELDEAALDALIDKHPLLRRTARTITEPRQLKAELAKVRQQGWCLVNEELEEGLVSLSAPIRDRAGRAIAAMNISGQVNRTSPEFMVQNFLPKLREAAAEISQMLQHKS